MSLESLSRALGLGPSPATVIAAMEALYRSLTPEIEGPTAGLDLPCKPGCDACCHESVFLSAPELLFVAAELMRARDREDRRALVAQMRALAEKFADELELLETLGPGEERDEVAARVRFRCPLLGGDGRCTVYWARELNARTFGHTYDARAGQPYGCELTHARLKVLQSPPLFDAREARRRLVLAVPGTERVHVYPWWFARYGDHLLD